MKICADEHVSPKIVEVVRDIALSPNYEICHISDAGNRGASDVSWITEFARDNGKAILTADSDFHKRPHQVMAVWESGLIVIHLHAKWANSQRRVQAACILYWWEAIENTLAKSPSKRCWRVPLGFPKKALELKNIGLDYERARRNLKRDDKRRSRNI